MRKCTRCMKEKSNDQFGTQIYKRHGVVLSRLRSWCQDCCSSRHRREEKRIYLRNREWPLISYLRKLANMKKCKMLRDGVDYNISADFLFDLYQKQEGRCALTGRLLKWRTKIQRTSHITEPDSLSIDRIEPAKGYVRGNVRLVTWQINHARAMWPDTDLIALCRDVLKTIAPAEALPFVPYLSEVA